MPSFWHHHKKDPVRPKAGCIVQRLTDFCGGGVADDEDVFAPSHIHAGVDDGSGTPGHFFAGIHLCIFGFFAEGFGDGDSGIFVQTLGFVHDVLDVLVNNLVIILARTFSPEREDHVTGTVQMFLNVCFFISPCAGVSP